MEKDSRIGLMKIGELARAAGVSVTTVKYYVKEGLLHSSCKTGPNMAYYAPECVERISRIKTLQKERFYPLSVIRELLDRQGGSLGELGLLDAIHKVDYRSSNSFYSFAEALHRSGLTRAQAAELEKFGVITPETEKHRKLYREGDVQIMSLVRRRLDAGLPLAHTIRAFLAYDGALRQAVAADINSFIRANFFSEDLTAATATRRIQVSDETLDSFVSLRRAALNREYGSAQLDWLDRFDASLETMREELAALLRQAGQAESALLSQPGESAAETSPEREALRGWQLLAASRGGDIARRAAACGKASAYFAAPREEAPSLTVAALRFSWLFLAPPALECAGAAGKALEQLYAAAEAALGREGEAWVARLNAALSRSRQPGQREQK